jgi:hypothetical protein
MGQLRLQSLPDPACDILTGRVLKTFDVVQVIVIQLSMNHTICLGDIGKIHDPATVVVPRAVDADPDGEGMAVKSSTLVLCGDVGQAMSRFKTEFFEYFHKASVPWLLGRTYYRGIRFMYRPFSLSLAYNDVIKIVAGKASNSPKLLYAEKDNPTLNPAFYHRG